MENIDHLTHALEALGDLLEGADPAGGGSLPDNTAAWSEEVRGTLYRAKCFLDQIAARSVPADLSPFFLTPKQREELLPDQAPVRWTSLLRRINGVAAENACRPLTGAELTSWLVEQGLYAPFPEEGNVYVLTPEGEAAGLRYDWSSGFPVLYCDPPFQRLILARMEELMEHVRSRRTVDVCPPVHPRLLSATVQEVERLAEGRHPQTGEPLDPEDPLCREATVFSWGARTLRREMENEL